MMNGQDRGKKLPRRSNEDSWYIGCTNENEVGGIRKEKHEEREGQNRTTVNREANTGKKET